jgi:purine-binding chemotaxis protein CheW
MTTLGLDGTQVLLFVLGEAEYAVEIRTVEEIRPASVAVTPVPRAPQWVRGVMNLRGVIVPVYDLRARFGMPRLADERFAVVVVVRVAKKTVGLFVDSVADVATIDPATVQAQSTLGADVAMPLIAGIGHVEARVVMLLALDELVRADADGDEARG